MPFARRAFASQRKRSPSGLRHEANEWTGFSPSGGGSSRNRPAADEYRYSSAISTRRGPHRIHADVTAVPRVIFKIPNPTVRKTCLPRSAAPLQMKRESPFDELHGSFEGNLFPGRDQCVQMIGHDQEFLQKDIFSGHDNARESRLRLAAASRRNIGCRCAVIVLTKKMRSESILRSCSGRKGGCP